MKRKLFTFLILLGLLLALPMNAFAVEPANDGNEIVGYSFMESKEKTYGCEEPVSSSGDTVQQDKLAPPATVPEDVPEPEISQDAGSDLYSRSDAMQQILNAQHGSESTGFDALASPVYTLPKLDDNIGMLNQQWLEMQGTLENYGVRNQITINQSALLTTASLQELFQASFGEATMKFDASALKISDSFDLKQFMGEGKERREEAYGSFMDTSLFEQISAQTNMSEAFAQSPFLLENSATLFGASADNGIKTDSATEKLMAAATAEGSNNQLDTNYAEIYSQFEADSAAYRSTLHKK